MSPPSENGSACGSNFGEGSAWEYVHERLADDDAKRRVWLEIEARRERQPRTVEPDGRRSVPWRNRYQADYRLRTGKH